MRIVLASSEAAPFAKSGGLGDVTPALTKALSRIGHEVVLIVPYYPRKAHGVEVERTKIRIEVKFPEKAVTGRILTSKLAGCDAQVWLVEQSDYFDRPELYTQDGHDYEDNCERFVFFCRAVMETLRLQSFSPDVVHVHDWQTGLLPALLEIEYSKLREFAETASVLTIHNMAFQGRFWHWDMPLTGLGWQYFNARQMEFYNHLNLLKTGIVFSDVVTTVSPTYAEEIQTEDYGCGLDGLLRGRRQDLVGILNGVDTDVWNPARDPHLAANYTSKDWKQGKSLCKAALQQEMKLPEVEDAVLFGLISRLTDQKGLDLITARMDEMLDLNAQFVFLGTGEARYERMLQDLSTRHPEQVATVIGYDDALAHRIEAGCDAYLMPSRFEPCGLNQMYSLRYGTLPVVRAVGGLADSVVDATATNLAAKTATGFVFRDYDSGELCHQVRRAVALYEDKAAWGQMVLTGMEQDLSWNRSAADYVEVYERARNAHQSRR